MIAALIAILFLGGGVDSAVMNFVAYMQGSVKEVVADDERQAVASGTVKDMKELTSAHTKANQKAFKTLLGEVSEMETDVDIVNALWEDHLRAAETYNEQMIDLRFELRDLLTREEWQAIFSDTD